MSFNRLPDDLIAQIGSKLAFPDLVNFLQTQKRVHAIVKRYKLDKPDIEQIEIVTTVLPLQPGNFTVNVRPFAAEYFNFFNLSAANLPENITEMIRFLSTKFRSIKSVRLNMKDGTRRNMLHLKDASVVKDLTEMSAIVPKIELAEVYIDIPRNEFIGLCKSFKEVTLDCWKGPEQVFCDEVLIEILSSTKINIHGADKREYVPFSDRLLDAMIESGKLASSISFGEGLTSFTVNGIRRFVEHCLKEGHKFKFYAGVNVDSDNNGRDARDWRHEVENHPEIGYTCDIRAGRTHGDEGFYDFTGPGWSVTVEVFDIGFFFN